VQFLRKQNSILVAVILMAVVAGTLSPVWAATDRAGTLRNLEKFSRVYQKIVASYVEEEDSDELIDAAIEAMIQKLDPFSQYMDQETLEALMVKTRGEFGGLGIIIGTRDDYPTVISPIEDTPAHRLGIMAGDKIVEIEGENTKGWRVEEVVERLRGPKGEPVDIGIERYGVDEILPYHVVRDIIPVKSVPYYFVLDGDVGYIRCTNFGEKTAEEIRVALEDLESQGIESLILDLRGNPGGLLDSAREVSDLFLDAGRLIVSTKGRNEKRLQEIYAHESSPHAFDYPLVVMINEGSASASEIVAGAIQDWDRGLVVGHNSFGKGSVQSIFSVSDREALKLTTAKYYTPSGRCIHKAENNERFDGEDHQPEYELETEPEFPVLPDSLPVFETLRLHRLVYGGGGIKPDIKLDGDVISDTALDLIRRSAFFNFAVHLVAEREVTIDFTVDDETLDKFREFMTEEEIEIEDQDFADNADYIEYAIRYEVIYKKFGNAEAARVTLGIDKVLQESLDLLRGSKTLKGLFLASEEAIVRMDTAETKTAD
jgi:carboxyl-terminal processing protease